MARKRTPIHISLRIINPLLHSLVPQIKIKLRNLQTLPQKIIKVALITHIRQLSALILCLNNNNSSNPSTTMQISSLRLFSSYSVRMDRTSNPSSRGNFSSTERPAYLTQTPLTESSTRLSSERNREEPLPPPPTTALCSRTTSSIRRFARPQGWPLTKRLRPFSWRERSTVCWLIRESTTWAVGALVGLRRPILIIKRARGQWWVRWALRSWGLRRSTRRGSSRSSTLSLKGSRDSRARGIIRRMTPKTMDSSCYEIRKGNSPKSMRQKTDYTFRGVSKEGIQTVSIKDKSTLICNNNRTKRDCIRISMQITGNIPIIFCVLIFNQ